MGFHDGVDEAASSGLVFWCALSFEERSAVEFCSPALTSQRSGSVAP